MTNELPQLDAARCTGCSLCVGVCPTTCMGMAGRVPWLPRPRDCIACSACALVCPTGAIQMSKTAN